MELYSTRLCGWDSGRSSYRHLEFSVVPIDGSVFSPESVVAQFDQLPRIAESRAIWILVGGF